MGIPYFGNWYEGCVSSRRLAAKIWRVARGGDCLLRGETGRSRFPLREPLTHRRQEPTFSAVADNATEARAAMKKVKRNEVANGGEARDSFPATP
jgi:hypothetical protein